MSTNKNIFYDHIKFKFCYIVTSSQFPLTLAVCTLNTFENSEFILLLMSLNCPEEDKSDKNLVENMYQSKNQLVI